MHPLIINEQCLQRQIDELAAISEAPAPVVTRVLFSAADQRGREFVKNICGELGLAVREDAVGNIFARWPGTERNLPAIATGSHTDAIPNAGRYDGVVGVLGALEAVRALKESGFTPRRPVELIVFTAEEPTRFGIGCLGSRLLAGALPLEKAAALRDQDGKDLESWRLQAGCHGALESVQLAKHSYAGFVELHIEQGPVLENENIPIGIVERIAAPATMHIDLTGVGGHAGALLMDERRDALVAAAEIAVAVESVARTSASPDAVGTTGVFRIEPGAVNSVPFAAHLEIDVRDTDLPTRDLALARIRWAATRICERRGIELKLAILNADVPAICDARLVETVANVCGELSRPAKKMISRAYHDSLFMAQLCPTTMIFIPCREGVSHRPDEYSSPEQIQNGVTVLAHTLAKLAS